MRIQHVFILSFLVLASCRKDKVQIIEDAPTYSVEYTNWSNTVITDSLLLDLNGDNIPDFRLKLYEYIAGQTGNVFYWNNLTRITALNDDFSFSFGKEYSQSNFDCLRLNDLIDENITWYGNGVSHNFHTNIFSGQYLQVGLWDIFDHDNHIGYRQKSGDSYCYGWIELNTSLSEIVLVESAVNTTPNEEIPTGYRN